MKVRNGFVSNSSSSSFILGFKKIPTTAAELKRIFFNTHDDLDQREQATFPQCVFLGKSPHYGDSNVWVCQKGLITPKNSMEEEKLYPADVVTRILLNLIKKGEKPNTPERLAKFLYAVEIPGNPTFMHDWPCEDKDYEQYYSAQYWWSLFQAQRIMKSWPQYKWVRIEVGNDAPDAHRYKKNANLFCHVLRDIDAYENVPVIFSDHS